VSEVNAFEDEFARQIARGLELAGEVERLEAEVERLRADLEMADEAIRKADPNFKALQAEVNTAHMANEAHLNLRKKCEAEVERLRAAADRMEALANERWAVAERLRNLRCPRCGEWVRDFPSALAGEQE